MRITSLLTSFLVIPVIASAQLPDSLKGWRANVDFGLAATQATYSDNWTGGEAGSFNWAANFKGDATKWLSTRVQDKTQLKLSFGQTLAQKRDESNNTYWERPRKSTDLIDFETVFRFVFNGYVDPYLAGRIESQFTDESYRPVRRYLSPTKFTESGGVVRVFINRTNVLELSSRFGFAFRQIMSNQIIDTVAEGTHWHTTNDGGLESVTDFKAQLAAKLTYTSKLSLYKALFFSESDKVATNDWKTVDANWEHFLTASITKVVQTVLYVQVLYDKEIDDGARFKQTLGLGLAYKWSK